MRTFPLLVLAIVGCGNSSTTGDAGVPDAAISDAAVSDGDAAAPALGACPSSGLGAIDDPNAICATVLPPATGADPAGDNADKAHYALRPASGGDGALVVFLNGSEGDPAHLLYDPAKNVLTAAVAAGHHAIGLSYRSSQIIGVLCAGNDICFLPTRLTIVTGAYQPGASAKLADILPSEGIEARLRLLLVYLASADPSGQWGSYLSPDQSSIVWDHVIVSGHSQGGGHAALLAKLHAVARLVTLSSPCDSIGSAPPVPASWLTPDASWATSPATSGYGLSAATDFDGGAPVGGDTDCPAHAAVWQAMGLAPANRHDDAVVCAGAKTAHSASIQCTENWPEIVTLYTLP